MGSLTNRGTRDRPRWYGSYKDLDGRRKMRALPGVFTKVEAARALAAIEGNVVHGRIGIAPKVQAHLVRDAMETWLATRRTRNKVKDEQRARKHLLPAFGDMTMAAAQEVTALLPWLAKLRGAGELQEATIRSLLTLLSGFWTYAVEWKLASMNPVRQMPRRDKPKRKEATADHPWLKTDAEVWRVLEALKEPVRTCLWLTNRTGMRPGEAAGLRMSDLEWLDKGIIRVRHNYRGPLKETKEGDDPKIKWVPAPDDWKRWLGPVIAERKAHGAGPEDVVFRYVPDVGRPRKDSGWEGLNEDAFKNAWRPVRDQLKLGRMRFYDAGRHSFVSRNLAAGVSIDEVSAAVGHSSILVTKAAYSHFIRKEFSLALRAPLGKGSPAEAKLPTDARMGHPAPGGATTKRNRRKPQK